MNEVELDVVDLKELILSNNSFGPNDVAEIRQMIAENYGHFAELRDAVNEMEDDPALTPAGSRESADRFRRPIGGTGALAHETCFLPSPRYYLAGRTSDRSGANP